MKKVGALMVFGCSSLACGLGAPPVARVAVPQPEAVISATAEVPAPLAASFVPDGAALLALIPEDAHEPVYGIGDQADGSINGQAVKLTRDVMVAGVPCAAERPVEAYPERWVCTIAAPTAFAGVEHAAGDWAVLYYIGRPKVLRSSGNIDVGGVPCEMDAALAPDGTLDACTLAGPHDFQGGLHVVGYDTTSLRVHLREGLLTQIDTTGDPCTIAGQTYAGGHILSVDVNGVVTDEGSRY